MRVCKFRVKTSRYLALLLLAALLLACRADPAPDSGFLTESEKMHEDEKMPFNAVWFVDDLDWYQYEEIVVAPVDTAHLEKMSWWDKASTGQAAISSEEEAPVLAIYFKEQLLEELKSDERQHYRVVETPLKNTLILETAIVEVVPTKVWLNTIGYVLVGALDFGTVAFEGRFRDAATGKVVAKFKDREHGQMALLSVADLQWYSHAHHIIDRWAEKVVEVANSKPGEQVESNYTVTLRPW